jgi:hypothetical protein
MRLSPANPASTARLPSCTRLLASPRGLHEVEVAVSLSGQPADPATRVWMDRLLTAIDTETLRELDPAAASTRSSCRRRLRGRRAATCSGR